MDNYYSNELRKAFKGREIQVKFVGDYEVNKTNWLNINRDSAKAIIEELQYYLKTHTNTN